MVDLTAFPFSLEEKEAGRVADMIGDMTDREKIGQLFCVLGPAYSDEELRKIIADYSVGGVLYRPLPADELLEKWRQLDACAAIPLLKAANLEEGGYGADSEGTYFGSQMQVAAADDPEVTKHFAQVCAVEGRRAGCNWNFAPVSDIDFNYQNPITNVRTYGSDPEKVCRNVEIFVRELQKCGMAAACKHFPGDGVDYRDQHLHPTYNTLPAEKWYATYGNIYKKAIDAGLLSVMVGHIVQPNVEKDLNPCLTDEECLPASMSREMITGVLRGRYGFNGLIITDATIMGGYCMAQERRLALPATIMAGCDMFCFSTDFFEDYQYLLEALDAGILTEERLNDAVTRILGLKAKIAAMNAEIPEIQPVQWKRACVDRAITLVKDTQGLIPVSRASFPKIKLIFIGQDDMPEGGTVTDIAARYLETQGFSVSLYDPLKDELHGTAGLTDNTLTLMLVNLPAASNQTTVRIQWCRKHALDGPRFVNEEKICMISFNNPYHLQDAPRVRTYINAYAPTKESIISSLEKLLGISGFYGVSPSDPFCGLMDTHF